MVCLDARDRPLWDTINVAVMIVGLAVVSSRLFGSEMRSLIGYIGPGSLSGQSSQQLCLRAAAPWCEMPISFEYNISVVCISRAVFKTFITFGHHLILYLIGVAFGLVPLAWAD